MRNNKITIKIVMLICGFLNLNAKAEIQNTEPNAAELVRAVRESENWIHEINSLQFRVEGKWSHPPESIAAKYAELKKLSPDEEPDPNRNWELKPSYGDNLEYAIDFKNKFLRYVKDTPGKDYAIYVWDGRQALRYIRDNDGYQQYDIDPTTEMIEIVFGSVSWPKSQPHSFWWKPRDVNEAMYIYGYPEDFRLVGKEIYRGTPCYILEYDYVRKEDSMKRVFKWFVGIDDHLRYVRIEGSFEYWTLDYKEIAPGCKIPTTQGYSMRNPDGDFIDFQRDVKLVDIKINKPLPEELFQLEFEEGLPVYNRQTNKFHTHVDKPKPLLRKQLPDITELVINLEPSEVDNKKMLICFFDYQQRPSRNCIMQIARQSEQLKEQGIAIFAVQASQVDQNTLNNWQKENAFEFPIDMIQTDEKKTKISWGVQSLPWLILTDKNHVVVAEGFALNELNDKIKDTQNINK